MNQHSVESTFIDRIRNIGESLETLTPSKGIDLMLNFYDDAVDGSRNDHGNMLLYQWGTYDWGEGESFELDITRQLIFGEGEDEDIFQLSLTFKFVPTMELRQLASGNRWCSSRDEIEEFRHFINHSAPFLAANQQVASSVQLEYGIAG
jgi:hypothetical protein